MHLLADNVLYVIRLLCFGRFLVGLGIGISAVVVPVYLGEVAPAQVTFYALQHMSACSAVATLSAILLLIKLRDHLTARYAPLLSKIFLTALRDAPFLV